MAIQPINIPPRSHGGGGLFGSVIGGLVGQGIGAAVGTLVPGGTSIGAQVGGQIGTKLGTAVGNTAAPAGQSGGGGLALMQSQPGILKANILEFKDLVQSSPFLQQEERPYLLKHADLALDTLNSQYPRRT